MRPRPLDRTEAAAQVFVEDPAQPVISVGDQHHLDRVLRLRAGEVVLASDGKGRFVPCRYSAPGRQVDERDQAAHPVLVPFGEVCHVPRSPFAVTVGFVPAKGDRPEWVVQKLTEIGVDRIVVLSSVRAVVRWQADRAERALARLRVVSRQAAAQSRRAWVPEISGVMTLADLLAAADPPNPPEPGRVELGPGPPVAGTSVAGTSVAGPSVAVQGTELALAHPGAPPPSGSLRAVAVGPEGGWDESELSMAALRVGLSDGVLRAETAAVVAGFALCALRDGLLRWSGSGACNHHAK